MAARVRAEGVPPARLSVIENWADRAIAPVPRDENPLRRAWGLPQDATVIAYSGNLGRAHLPEQVAALVRHSLALPDVIWVFIGGGAGLARLRDDAALRETGRVLFYPYQPRDSLSMSLSVGDAHLIVLNPECDGLILPSKYYGVRAVARPILYLGSPTASVARFLTDDDLLLPSDAEATWRPLLRDWLHRDTPARSAPVPSAADDAAPGLKAWQSLIEELSQQE